MIESTEVISLLLATGVLVFLFVYRANLRAIPDFGLLSAAYFSLCASLVLTVLEGFAWGEALNVAEHLMNLASTVLLTAWIVLACSARGRDSWPS